ncbi:Isonitrile hydratase [Metarhizium brunneum]|uniref:DJ-1/PfpI domain-containing protein n=6 Tax=Metarhizium TaxID=5529 RepID=A0A0D9P1C9_METAN
MSPVADSPPVKYGILLFPGFQALDAFGPIDILNMLSQTAPVHFSIIAATLEPVSTKVKPTSPTVGQSVVPTHSLDNAPEDLEVLLVPGGGGTRQLESTEPLVAFLRATYPKLRYLLTVCTGSSLAARAGLLEGKKATTNKLAYKWVVSLDDKVDWVAKARWVTDGNIWTSSGISAGIDMMYAFVSEIYGPDVAGDIARRSEYIRNTDSADDPFASLV